jgi:MarR family transcriptional regulator for hemolysin
MQQLHMQGVDHMPVVSRNLNMLARCGAQFRSVYLKPLGITAFQAPYIQYICGQPGMSQEQVAQALQVNRSSAARHLAALEEDGFVTRQESREDKRQLLIYPTQKALDASPEIRRVNTLWNDWLTKGMTEEEVARLEELLERLRLRALTYVKVEEQPR